MLKVNVQCFLVMQITKIKSRQDYVPYKTHLLLQTSFVLMYCMYVNETVETPHNHSSNHPDTFNMEDVSTAVELSAYSFETLTQAIHNTMSC